MTGTHLLLKTGVSVETHLILVEFNVRGDHDPGARPRPHRSPPTLSGTRLSKGQSWWGPQGGFFTVVSGDGAEVQAVM